MTVVPRSSAKGDIAPTMATWDSSTPSKSAVAPRGEAPFHFQIDPLPVSQARTNHADVRCDDVLRDSTAWLAVAAGSSQKTATISVAASTRAL